MTPLLHKKLYGDVPPVTLIFIEPLLLPGQVSFVVPAIETTGDGITGPPSGELFVVIAHGLFCPRGPAAAT